MISVRKYSGNLYSRHSVKSLTLLILAIALMLVSVSLYESIFTWVMVIITCSAVIRGSIYFQYYKHLPSIRTLNLLAILCILGLVYSSLSTSLLAVMVNLLVLASGLKLMQAKQQRDVYLLVICMFFVIGCGFIFNQSVGFYVFYTILSFIIILSLACFHAPSLPLKKQCKTVFTLSIQALPICIILFLVIPHFPPLWQIPTSKSTQTGLTEKVTPGDIAKLTQSDDLAFRATFNDSVPEYKDRYWRAIVMEEFDGKTWQISQLRKDSRQQLRQQAKKFTPVIVGPSLDYEVIAEPTQQSWLYALDLAVLSSNQQIWQSRDFQLIKNKALVNQFSYSVRSYPEAMAQQSLSRLDAYLNLKTPENGNPKTRTWVANQRKLHPENSAFINAVLNHFTNHPFHYTLRPELMLVDPIDVFLFDKQSGFCSHYASALAYMLRLGNIPARVVTGYQGGELIAQANQAPYMSIYQYDAHAWVELWIDEMGWHRLDPTELVSPDRIEFGLRHAMSEEGSFLFNSTFSLARMTDVNWLNSLRLFLADIDYDWSRFILGFDKQSQYHLFKLILGQVTPDKLSILGLCILSFIGLLICLFFLPHWLKNRVNTTQSLYFKAIRALEKNGAVRSKWQAPLNFSEDIQKHYPPHVSDIFDQITQLYIEIQYQDTTRNQLNKQRTKVVQRIMREKIRTLKKELIKRP